MMNWISTKDAMQTLGVSATTIKRWADNGTLPSARTPGGHRRYQREAVDRLLIRQVAAGKNSSAGELIELLTEESDIMKICDRIVELRDQIGDWFLAADHLNSVMSRPRSDQPHDGESDARSLVAAGRLGLALSLISKSFAVQRSAPVVLTVSSAGHHLSYRQALVELCVVSEGMSVRRAQQATSTRDLMEEVNHWSPCLVILTAATQCVDCDSFSIECRRIAAACRKRGVSLAVGFGVNLRGAIGYRHHCQSFGDLGYVLGLNAEIAKE